MPLLFLADMNIGRLASGFGLLKIPKMPELRGKVITDFQGTPVDINTIPYL